MSDVTTILLTLVAIYALVIGVFLISENRRPQSTLAWLLVFFFAPGVGVVVYLLFGRDWKAFSKQSRLLMQDLRASAGQALAPHLANQEQALSSMISADPAHRRLIALIRRNSRGVLTHGNHVEILQDASRFYQRMLQDIDAARHSIHLQYFIWRNDPFTRDLARRLAEKVRQGVQVRLLYDPVGSVSPLHFPYFRRLRAAGVEAAPTSPLWQLHTISYRNHRKITVIDGRIGYAGGMNIGQEHLDGGKGFDHWRDTQIRFTGPAAALLQGVFAVDWHNAVRRNLFLPEYFPVTEAEAPVAPAEPRDASTEPRDASAVRETGPVDRPVPVQILTSGPDSQWAAIRQLYAQMIASAQQQVRIQSPYFILDATITEALRLAAMSGVDVRVMLSKRESGKQVVTWAANTYITDVVGAGVRVYLYDAGYLHAKTISIDSSICSVGSANIDIRSFSINYEINAVLYSPGHARALEAAFEADLSRCTRFRLSEYESRNSLLRFRDSAARLLSPLL